MSYSPAPSDDPSTGAKKRYVCRHCDKAFSTSSHLGRHSRVHTGEKKYKCDFPGCETRCSRADNLQAHKRIHLSPQPRTKETKKSEGGSGRSAAAKATPVPSSSSSSPMTTYQASPSEMFRSPASRFRSVSAGNSPQRVMSPQFPPSGSPRPLYDGYSGLEDQFNTFAFMGRPSSAHTSRAAMPPQGYPRLPHGMPPPIVSGSPDDAFDAFNSSMLLQDASPMRRRSNVYQPLPPGGSAYPYPTYPGPLPPPAPHGQYPPNASSPRRRSHTPSPEFFDLRQLPRY